MAVNELKVKLTFTNELLGTWSSDPEIAKKFIASKAPDAKSLEEEVANLGVDAVVEQGKTVFPRNSEGVPILYGYQILGFFKAAARALARDKSTKTAGLKAYIKIIDGNIRIKEREIPIIFDGEIGSCQRPLRAQTPQGERVAIANSETIPEGASAEFTIKMLGDWEKYVKEWLSYGEWSGIGQWRNSGKGQFTWEIIA